MAAVDDVKLIICDVDNDIFTDPQIEQFLTIENQNVKRASATALMAIANSSVLLGKRAELLDAILEYDGPAIARQLREQAKELRDQAEFDEAGTDDQFKVAEMVTNEFGAYEYLRNESLREGC